MDTKIKVRRLYFIDKMSKLALARKFNLSRNTVKRILKADEIGQAYDRSSQQPKPRLGEFTNTLETRLTDDSKLAKKERRSAKKYYAELVSCGYQGAYDSVQRYVKKWKEVNKESSRGAYVPLCFDPAEAYQFDWSEEVIDLAGVKQKVKVAHFRLCYSRKSFVVAYFRETQEMLFDAHNKAFNFFGGLPLRGIYDNMKTAVDSILIGKERKFNHGFLAMMNHFLIEPTACSPAAGWEKGQIENQVGNVREWFFTPRLKFANLAELNNHLEIRCNEIADKRKHPEFKSQTITDVFLQEHPKLRELKAPFEGFKGKTCNVSSTCLINYDNNRYSVDCAYANKAVTARAYADRIDVFSDSEQIATHIRCFSRDKTILNPYHYLPLLERKPGALRNGAPFKQWKLPVSILQTKEILMRCKGGDKECASILLAMTEYGMEEVSVACELALKDKIVSRDNIINIMNRLRDTAKCEEIIVPQALVLKDEPSSDCTRFNALLTQEAFYATAQY